MSKNSGESDMHSKSTKENKSYGDWGGTSSRTGTTTMKIQDTRKKVSQ